ncbi:hypothetical protein D3C77_418420 [compost metagenome]
MRPIAVFWACLTSAAFAFLIGVTLAGYANNHRITQAEHQHPPPAGEQFSEGPVLARLPRTNTNHVRYIF